MRIALKKGAKIVVKIGSSLLTNESGRLDMQKLETITKQMCSLKNNGYHIILVSSGAIACGMEKLGLENRPVTVIASSGTAAVGQIILMDSYGNYFRKNNFLTAQILLTSDGLQDRKRYLNARNTVLHLLDKGNIVPIINENDAVITDEIKFGDNDKLSAQVATLIDAQLLIILSDIDGVYDKQGKVIETIDEIDDCLISVVKDTKGKTTVGGMITKFEAAKIATNAGIPLVIANGNDPKILNKIIKNNKAGTIFLPKDDKISGKKRWIAFSCKDCGKIIIDQGAAQAVLEKGKSLLAIGIKAVEGDFSFGDLIVICNENHQEIARGLVNYSSDELKKIKGIKTDEIENILKYKSYDEVVHRDNLVVIK
ncbi:MAG: glutamate 5-kinase [Candidatus Omnitrophota bacterium]